MTLKEKQNETPESVDPSGFWRFVFWLTFVLGNLVLVFAFLLSMVPRPLHDENFTLDYIVRSFVVGLMLISILMARWLWKIKSPIPRGPLAAMNYVLLFAWIELAMAVYGIVGLAAYRLFRI
jgi:hypothetical protein